MHNRHIIAALAVGAMVSIAGVARADTAPAAAPAAATDWQAYGALGYNYLHGSPDGYSVDLGALTGRVGLRYQQYLGVEAEVSTGIADQSIGAAKVSLDTQYAIYAMGYLPVAPRADLFARVGYGNAKLKASGYGVSVTASGDIWAYGVGGQYFLSDKDGLRAEYTRYASTDSSQADVDSFSISYVRKF